MTVKNNSPKGSYFLVSRSVFLLKKLDHMLPCHMPSPHMWLHPSCSRQLTEVILHICLSWGCSVLLSPQCHRDGGRRAWTVWTIRGRTKAEASVRSHTRRRQFYHPWQVDYMGRSRSLPSLALTPTLEVGLSSLPDVSLPTPLSEGWVRNCGFVDTGPYVMLTKEPY